MEFVQVPKHLLEAIFQNTLEMEAILNRDCSNGDLPRTWLATLNSSNKTNLRAAGGILI